MPPELPEPEGEHAAYKGNGCNDRHHARLQPPSPGQEGGEQRDGSGTRKCQQVGIHESPPTAYAQLAQPEYWTTQIQSA